MSAPLPEDLCVVICTYNRCALLDRTLHALGEQQVRPTTRWSVLVVENNCTDRTREVVAAHQALGRIPCLRIASEPVQGATAARRRGVVESRASWIALVDDDVLLDPDWVGTAVEFVAENPGAGVLCGRIDLVWEQDPPPALALDCKVGFAFLDYGPEARRFPATGLVHMVSAAMLLRREAAIEAGWLEHTMLVDRVGASLSSGGDMELATRVAQAGFERWYCPDLVARHIIPPHRTTLRYLCRLFYGMARSSAQLTVLGMSRSPSLGWRVRRLMGALKYLCRRWAGLVLHDWLAGRRGTKRQVQIYEAWGHVASAWSMLAARR